MTIAEVILIVVGGAVIYRLLRPLQLWFEHRLLRAMSRRRLSSRPPIIDVADFASHSSFEKDKHDHRS